MGSIGGYAGRILWVDLSSGRTWEERLPEAVLRRHIGGTGLGAYLLMRQETINAPLAPESPIIFSTGPLTGTRAPTAGKWAIMARSPQTGYWGESDVGGKFGTALKGCRWDALVVVGQSTELVYLFMDETGAQIRSAAHLQAMDTYDTCGQIRTETNHDASVAAIGLPGEHCVPLACIMVDGDDARAAGRCGLGAVMGSKRLKAVAVQRGQHAPEILNPALFAASLKESLPDVVIRTKRLKQLGTVGGVVANALIGDMSARNWTIGDWIEPAEKIGGEQLANTVLTKNYYCDKCIIGCGRVVKPRRGLSAGKEIGGPEYETVAGFGAQLLIQDLDAIVELNDQCNRHGLDTISTSAVIAMGMEAREQGLLTGPGSELLQWSDAEAVLELVGLIAQQEGIGRFLGQGVRSMAQQLGPAAHAMAVHVRGMEPAYHDPRALSSLAVGYATHPRGACHRGCTHYMERYAFPELGWEEPFDRHAPEGKGRAAARLQDLAEVYNDAKLCQLELQVVPASRIAQWISAVTGWDMDGAELLTVGERNFNLKRLYNIQVGGGAQEDRLPYRIAHQPFASGNSAGFTPVLEPMLTEYYEARGWTVDGVPTDETLVRLGLK